MTFCGPKSLTWSPKFLTIAASFLILAVCSRGQDSGGDNLGPRGNRGEISITVRDSAGQPLPVAATVRLYHQGMPAGQGITSHGRAFFMTQGLGNFTVNVEATGFKPAQREVSMPIAVRAEVDVILVRLSDTGDGASVSQSRCLLLRRKKPLTKLCKP